MAIDSWGRYVPDYNYNVNDYREELLRQRTAIENRLSEFDKRYQPQQQVQTQQQMSQLPPNTNSTQTQTPDKIAQPYIVVENEKAAYDYPIVNRIDDVIGQVHIFALRDDSALFAKRINPSTFDMEFEAYDRRIKPDAIADSSQKSKDDDFLESIDQRLQKIEDFISTVSMFMTGGNQSTAATKVNKSTKQVDAKTNEPTSNKDESEAVG